MVEQGMPLIDDRRMIYASSKTVKSSENFTEKLIVGDEFGLGHALKEIKRFETFLEGV